VNIHENNLLVHQEAMYILIGSMIGIGIFSLANVLVKDAYEGAWISAGLGSVYPFYLGILAIYIIKKHPSENILDLSKKYMGNFLGTVMNIFFLLFFIFNSTFVISGFNIIYKIYTTPFLSNFRVISIMTLLTAFVAYKGLKLIGKLNSVSFYMTLILVLCTFAALRKGSYLNLMPVFGAGISGILKSSKESAFSYSGIEILFIIYPYIKENLKFRKLIFSGIGITALIYIITTVLALYYLSADIVIKTYWPLTALSDSLSFAAVNNFRIIFAFLWMGIALKTSVNYFFSAAFICENIFNKIKRINIIGILYFVIVVITLMLGEMTIRNKVMKMVLDKTILFNIIYVTLIAVLILIKKGEENEGA
jgi:spore germination protein (amino acid permease)